MFKIIECFPLPQLGRQILHQPSPDFLVLLVLTKNGRKNPNTYSIFDFRVLITRALHSAIIPISPNGPSSR
jgi:hypothetical protein